MIFYEKFVLYYLKYLYLQSIKTIILILNKTSKTMKKFFLVGALALCGAMSAQKNSVKANPFALLGGSDLVSYERAIGGNSTVGVGAGIGGFKLGGVKYSQAGGSVFYRYYFGEALKGWYGHGGVSYSGGKVKTENEGISFDINANSISANKSSEEVKFGAFGAQVKAGYQWVWNSGFTLDLNAGIGYTSFNYDNSETTGLKGNGILPALGVALGYSF